MYKIIFHAFNLDTTLLFYFQCDTAHNFFLLLHVFDFPLTLGENEL